MIYRLLIPTTIEDNDAVRVLEWHTEPGQAVAAGALIVEVETHKALIEIRAVRPSVLRERLCDEGAWCALGGALATFSDDPVEPLSTTTGELPADFLIG